MLRRGDIHVVVVDRETNGYWRLMGCNDQKTVSMDAWRSMYGPACAPEGGAVLVWASWRWSGRRTPRPPRCSTWVYSMVGLTSLCPSHACTVRLSSPSSRRGVVQRWRSIWPLPRCCIPAHWRAALLALCRTRSERGKTATRSLPLCPRAYMEGAA